MPEEVKVPSRAEVLTAWLQTQRVANQGNAHSPASRALDAIVCANIAQDISACSELELTELYQEFATAAGRVRWFAKGSKVGGIKLATSATERGLADNGSKADWNSDSGLPLLAILSAIGRRVAKLEAMGFTFTREPIDLDKLEKVRAKCLASKRFQESALAED